MNTRVIIVVLAILAIGGGYYYYTQKPTMAPATTQNATTSAPLGKIVPKWSFTSVPQTDESAPPQTKVTLTLGAKIYDAGTYAGNCSEIGASGGVDGKGLVSGEVSGVQCWFAGGGDEVGLFQAADGSLTIKHGDLDEPNGEGYTGLRGNFKVLVTL